MNDDYKKALKEVYEILNNTESEIVEKIPKKFISFLIENMDEDYMPEIDFYNENWEDTINEEARNVLAVIYREYVISNEERDILLKEELDSKNAIQKELMEKYDPFKNVNKNEEIPKEVQSSVNIAEVKEYPWYKRLYNKILKIFGKKG